jgi:predicted Zn-dependent protease with MMP-like domain
MMDFDEFENIALDEFESLPDEIKKNLNMGITVVRGHKPGKEGLTEILGEYYIHPVLGRGINIYYGSFMDVMGDAPEAVLREEIIHTVKHELRHHMEISAGVDYLGDEDRSKMVKIKERFGRLPSDETVRAWILNRIIGAIAVLVVMLLLIYLLVIRYM